MNRNYQTVGRRLFAVAVVTLFATVASCGLLPNAGNGNAGNGGEDNGSEEEATGSENVDTVFAVNVTPAVQGEINDYIEINGDVETDTSVDVFSDTNGEIARLYVRVGQTVEAGETIAEVDPSRPGQNFSLSPVRAPISGTITRLPARVGAQVTPSSPVGQVSRTNDLEISVNVAERFISKVSRGLPAVVSLDAFPDRTFDATVTDLSPVVDPLTRTLEVTLRFDEPDPVIRAGMFAEVRIITEQKDNIVKVPSDVVIRRFGDTFVYVVTEENTAERRSVNPGIEIDNKLEITEGLAPDERVVYQGQNLLEDGSRVRIIDTVEPLTAEDTVR
ncbi:MAG: efflux RND transporter periplasmic adaptor subunit [Alkalispirochaeta sp.]